MPIVPPCLLRAAAARDGLYRQDIASKLDAKVSLLASPTHWPSTRAGLFVVGYAFERARDNPAAVLATLQSLTKRTDVRQEHLPAVGK